MKRVTRTERFTAESGEQVTIRHTPEGRRLDLSLDEAVQMGVAVRRLGGVIVGDTFYHSRKREKK